MRRSITIAAAALFASSVLAGAAIAQNGNGNGNGNGGGNGGGHGGGHGNAFGASGLAPGHTKSGGDRANSQAPGWQLKSAAARDLAPGRAMRAETSRSSAVGARNNYGTVISLIRSGKADLTSLSSDMAVTFVEVDELKPTGNRTALDNALAARAAEIDALRTELEAAEIGAMAGVDLDTVVAARVARDGSLIVYVDED